MLAAVVIVDPQARSLVDGALRARGHEPVPFSDPEAALSTRAGFTLAVVEWSLVDGADFCGRLRAAPGAEDAAVLAWLADPAPAAVRAALEEGASDVLLAPVSGGQLEARLIAVEHALAGAAERRRLQADAREAEARFWGLAEASSEGVAVHEDGRLLAANPTLAAMLGVSLDELLGRHAADLATPESRARILERLGAPATTEPSQVCVRRADGSTVPVELGAVAVPFQGREARVVSVRDVSARVAAAAALAESEQSLAALLQSVDEGLIATDTEGRITRLNPVAERLTGWAAVDALGRPLADVLRLVDEETGAALEPATSRVLEERRSVSLGSRTVLVARNGARRPIAESAAPIRGPGAGVRGVVMVFSDVTEERRTRQALRRSQRELRTVIERAPCGMIIHRGGRLLYANPAMAAWLGYAPEELVGRQLQELVEAKDRERVLDSVRQMEATGVLGAPTEGSFLAKDGRLVDMEVNPGPFVDFEGAPAILVITTEVSQRRRIRAQLLLADRMVSVGTLAAGVAHEINNPLAYVISNLSYVADHLARLEGALPPVPLRKLQSAVTDAREGAERVGQIVGDLKMFSRVEEEKRHAVDVRPVLQSCLNMAWNEIRHRARLVREFGEAPRVWANEARLGQVFVNLLINAAQAIPEGDADRNEIRVVTRGGDGVVVVEVKDTGCGIPQDLRARVFDPFFTTKPEGVGTGLGLSVCLGIVSGMGGEIAVESRVGRGSVFRVTLPAVAAEEDRAEPPAAAAQAARRARILVVDDEPMVAASLTRVLEDEHDVVAVTSGREALARVAAGETFDVLLCDLMMPVLSGMELHAEIERLAPALARHTVFLTGGAFTVRAQQFLDATDCERLDKPFDADTLMRAIGRLLR